MNDGPSRTGEWPRISNVTPSAVASMKRSPSAELPWFLRMRASIVIAKPAAATHDAALDPRPHAARARTAMSEPATARKVLYDRRMSTYGIGA